MFRSVESNPRFPALETEIMALWKQRRTYEQSLARRANAPPFIFYEGPPTANGMPHPGHCLTRAIKDLFPRYRTMRGYRCQRKAGWDTHGLPVEVEVCKELGIHSKEEIEAFGVEPFIHRCQASVWRYMREWERLTERIGFWIHLDEAYVTYHQSYVESVWWSLKNLFERGLLYQGHKIVWWWAQGGTALSAGEVGQGYREVADPSVYVRFPLLDQPDTSLLVWTTTPWTLPSNQFAAVNPDLEYSVIVDPTNPDANLIVATVRAKAIVEKVNRDSAIAWVVKRTLKGSELVGRRYLPPFRYYYTQSPNASVGNEPKFRGDEQEQLKSGGRQHIAWRVVAADFVTTDSGTGVVHQAPAFGEVDFELLKAEQARFVDEMEPMLICAVGADGKFTAEAPEYQGRWVKEADKDIVRELRRRGLLYHHEQYLHEYPFCWRAEEDPLIQYPRRSWFIRTTRFKHDMLTNNARIHWLPEHIRDGRFGNFLETNVDWALSRERYWGTPLPIWVCEESGSAEAVASYEELMSKPMVSGMEAWEAAKRAKPELPDDLKVHKPYIDAITYASPFVPGKRMRRVSEVIDCWYDSGAMPFAQWGYPHQGREQFESQFPADFISEALDQTRGWFYSQLAISTLLFGEGQTAGDPAAPRHEYPHPFRNCIVLGLMLGEDGQKMSKSKRNYREPNEIFDRYGADALRWYFFANQAPWTSIRYSEQAIKDSIPEFLLRLWNVYSFFVIYANIDGFDPADMLAGDMLAGDVLAGNLGQLDPDVLARGQGYRPVRQRGELDRWITSELARTAAAVTERMDAYDNFAACGRITAFVDALSNWYVRRSRDRFWTGEQTADKRDAYWTLYECLLTTAKLIAPFVPFLAETLWQNLAVAATGGRALESVHLCDFPTGDAAVIDDALSEQMNVVREIVSLGRGARMTAKLKVRQPLAKVEIVLVHARHQAWLEAHAGLIREELNVKQVEFIPRADQYISHSVLPDLKRLGPRLGKRLPALKQALATADAAVLLARLEAEGEVRFDLADGPISLDRDDIQVRLQAKPGWAAAQGPLAVVVVSTELTADLQTEGLARELAHAIQGRRKDLDCKYTDRIEVGVVTESAELLKAIDDFGDYIRSETLSVELTISPIPGVEPVEIDLAGHRLALYVTVR
ncbi:MAG TPA: isoleucine--tRNA ligase [Pirellulales bacterium]|nr:isoleucine--tRNA ligase [Pirellulales bacterium]